LTAGKVQGIGYLFLELRWNDVGADHNPFLFISSKIRRCSNSTKLISEWAASIFANFRVAFQILIVVNCLSIVVIIQLSRPYCKYQPRCFWLKSGRNPPIYPLWKSGSLRRVDSGHSYRLMLKPLQPPTTPVVAGQSRRRLAESMQPLSGRRC
jgi:hypothetical protein